MDTLARIRLLTGDDPFWNAQNPTLLKGEVGFRNVEGDDPLMRVGDGIRPWTQLPDMNKVGMSGPAGPTGPEGPPGPIGERGPIGPPGDATSPWLQPFWVASPNAYGISDFVVARLGFSSIDQNNYIPSPEDTMSGHVGPYAWWFSPSEQWGLPAGDRVLEMHHYWPRTEIGQSGAGSSGGLAVATYWSIDGPSGPMIEINPDGSGRIGAHTSSSSTLYWYSDDNTAGASGFEFISPTTGKYGLPGGGTLNVWGLMSCHYRTAVPSGYPFYISNDAPPTPGQNAVNGLRIGAGWDRSDKPFRVVDTPGNTIFELRGDGAIFANPTRVTSGPFAVWYLTDGQIAVQSSSARYKTNIRSTAREKAREIVSRLRLVNFNSLVPDEDPDRLNYGLIAEEVEAVEPMLVGYKDGRPEGVNYQAVTLLLLPLVQELLGMTEPTGESYG